MDTLLERLEATLAPRFALLRERGGAALVPEVPALEVPALEVLALEVLATDVESGRPVRLHALAVPRGADAGGLLEAMRAPAALRHERILPVLALGGIADLVWLAVPELDGVSLRTWIERERRLPFLESVRVLREVTAAVDHAHRHGVRHRALAPERVLWHATHALVGGFGVKDALDCAGGVRGAEAAAAERADLRALGGIGYEVLTGEPPPAAGEAPSPARLRAHVPPGLARAIVRCLDEDPERRMGSAEELLRLLDGLVTPARGQDASWLVHQAEHLLRRGEAAAEALARFERAAALDPGSEAARAGIAAARAALSRGS